MQRDVKWVARQYALDHGKKLLGARAEKGKGQTHLRIRRRALAAIKYLACLSCMLHEKQQQQIFTKEELTPLIRSLFRATERIEQASNTLKLLANINSIEKSKEEKKSQTQLKMKDLARALGEHLDVKAETSSETKSRMLQLCAYTLSEIGVQPNAARLAPRAFDTLKRAGLTESFQEVIGIKAILIEAFPAR